MAQRLKMQLTQPMSDLLAKRRVFLNSSGIFRPQLLTFIDSSIIEPYTGFYGGSVLTSMGSFSFSRSILPSGMIVGRYCSIGPNLEVLGMNHPLEWITTSQFSYEKAGALVSSYLEDYPNSLPDREIWQLQKKLPVIQNDVWIGQNVTLSRGITIHNGAVVAANSNVTKSVSPYSIVGGNPARVLRSRFAPSVAASLGASGWWRYAPNDFFDLKIEYPEEFLEQFSKAEPTLIPFEPKPLRGFELAALQAK